MLDGMLVSKPSCHLVVLLSCWLDCLLQSWQACLIACKTADFLACWKAAKQAFFHACMLAEIRFHGERRPKHCLGKTSVFRALSSALEKLAN